MNFRDSSMRLQMQTPPVRRSSPPSYVKQRAAQQQEPPRAKENARAVYILDSVIHAVARAPSAPPPVEAKRVDATWTNLHELIVRRVAETSRTGAATESAQVQLEKLAALEENWDGCGATRIAGDTLTAIRLHTMIFKMAANLAGAELRDPWIAAAPDGTVGVDWRHDGRRLAMTYEAANRVEYFALGKSEFSGRLHDASDLLGLASWLLRGTPAQSLAR
jgi:hypothetical protein